MLLLFGGLTTISQNTYLMFTTTDFPGKYNGYIVSFTWPWFGNLVMFAAMSCVGFMWIY